MASKPKARTVRAWAVVCADGRWREPSTWSSRTDADDERKFLNKQAKTDRYDCGGNPHEVVTLTGTFTPKPKKGARNAR